MRKLSTSILMLCAIALSVILSGCGAGSKTDSASSGTGGTVSGVATTGSPVVGTVTLKDSSAPTQTRTTLTSNGTYSFDTAGMKAPYVLMSQATGTPGTSQMYSIAAGNGRTNINPVSDIAFAAASGNNSAVGLYESWDQGGYGTSVSNFEDIIEQLRVVLAPLYSLYQINNPVTDEEDWLNAMFKDVSFVIQSGNLVVTNKSTGGVIYKAPLSNITSGTLNTANLPGAPATPPAACTYTYSAWSACDSTGTQTRTVTLSSPAGCTGTPILSQSCTYVPPTPSPCTYTYGPWGACQSTGTQIRSLLSSSPAGCTGTPVLTQACTYVPPVTTCTSFTYSGWSACDSTGNQTRTVTSSSPAGCTGGSPVLTQACTPPPTTCTSFTYSAWSACDSTGNQTRTVTSSSPAGCTGGSPVLSQACTYVPPACTSFTYSAWGACQSNNTQTRTVTSSSPAGCTGGSPVLSQACTYVPPAPSLTLAQVKASCTMCHGLTVNTTVLASGGYTIVGRTAAQWLTSVNTMVGYGAPLAAGFTAQDYANFLAALP